jgi:hypothetical protein
MIEPKDELFEMNVTASEEAMRMENNFDELIDEILFSLEAFYGYASEMTKQYQEARRALTDAISAVTSERDVLQKREYELLTTISNGKKVKANAIYDFDRYQTAINAGYVDGLLYEHRARLAKDES